MSGNKDGRYYAKDGMVWKSPVETRHADGSLGISIGFPVCTMHDAAGAEQAETVAAMMNAGAVHEALVEALRMIEVDLTAGDMPARTRVTLALDRVRAALSLGDTP